MFISLYFVIRQNLPSISQFKRYMMLKKHKSKIESIKASPLKVLASPKIMTNFSPITSKTTPNI